MSLLLCLQILPKCFLVQFILQSHAGKNTKMIIVSTPYGMNQFYKLWVDAENKRNDYIPIEVH